MKKLKIILKNLEKKSLVFRKLVRKILNLYRHLRYKIRSLGQIVDDKMILFCSFYGKSYTDSPKAIYEYMQKQDKYKEYKYIWVFKELEKYEYLTKNKNTKIVRYNSKEYEQYLAKSKYWIWNYRTLNYITPKKNQIYVQCWHGTPLKKLGYDIENPDDVLNTKNEIRHKYKIDAKKFKYFLSPSKFATEKFISAWNLKKIKKENCIIQEGYPRNDFLFNYTDKDIQRIKEKLGITKTNKKIILYAPTWRDNQHKSEVGYTYKTELDFDRLQKELGQDYIILFRAHYLVANSFNFEKYKEFVYNVSDADDINELYIIADMLITDYSSVFFDYANLKRPIIYYMYDFEEYKNELRGFYIDLEELPGKIIKEESELIKEIKNISFNFKYDDKYQKFNDKYNYLDDGTASKRVTEKINI
ncbi:MAG: CDP-glycerol glycerophosphotransferase family protein [Clostridia bacterium]|nr:CDP-glycerol glycerophosphotransferase family protein [Clostridia bacterium]